MDLRVVVFVIVPVDVTMEEERTANSEEVKELLVVHREMEDEGGPKPPFEKPINPVPPKPDILRILEKPAVLFALGEDDPSRLGHRLGQVEQLRDSVPASPSPLVDEDLRDGGGAGRLRARGLQGRRGSSQQKRLKPGPDGPLVIQGIQGIELLQDLDDAGRPALVLADKKIEDGAEVDRMLGQAALTVFPFAHQAGVDVQTPGEDRNGNLETRQQDGKRQRMSFPDAFSFIRRHLSDLASFFRGKRGAIPLIMPQVSVVKSSSQARILTTPLRAFTNALPWFRIYPSKDVDRQFHQDAKCRIEKLFGVVLPSGSAEPFFTPARGGS